MLTWLSVTLGALLICLVAWDIFLTLLTSTGRGSVSRWLMSVNWRILSPIARRRRRYRELVGPVMFVSVLGSWVMLIIVGWALIYWPFLPDEFLVDFGLDSERNGTGNVLTALYLSMVVLSTVGFGDIVPTSGWLRLFVPLEGLVGFGLITAGISWFISINPALSRRRRLAHRIALVRDSEAALGERWDEQTAADLMDSFAKQLIEVRSDQLQFPIMYYFRDAAPQAELIPSLEYLREVAIWARDEFGAGNRNLHFHQHMLQRAIDEYVQTIASQFLRDAADDPQATLEALMDEHV